jgi:flagellar hook-associated protein 1 FlgK
MNSHLSGLERKAPILEEIQTTLDNFENVGLEGLLARFKDAISKYGTNSPDNLELASIVRNSAFDITKMLNSYARDLDKMLEDNVTELSATVDYVNTLIDRVVALNKAIVKEFKATEFGAIHQGRGVSPYGPLELMDERNLIIDELSSYVNLRIDENKDGSIKVFLGDVLMVDGENYEKLVMRDFEAFGAAVIHASNGQDINFRSGEIRAYIDVLNGNGPYANHSQSSDYGIPYYRAAMDAFAEAFAELMNRTNGVDNDNPHRAMFGSTLDVYDADGVLVSRGPITASTIRISDEWMQDAAMIGLVYNERIGSVLTSVSFPSGGGPYTFNVNLNGTTTAITFDGTVGDLEDRLEAAFPERFEVELDGGEIIISKLREVDRFNITTENAVTLTMTREDIETGGWAYSANLDGNHVKELLLALDEPVKFGRALDFEGTAFDYISFISNRLGQQISFIDDQINTMTVTTNNLLDSRDAIMGVSTDEEGINMLIYQKWYNAAARMMTALDDCLDRIINGMGRVGL